MNNIVKFPNSDVKEYRQKCCFMNRSVQIQGEDLNPNFDDFGYDDLFPHYGGERKEDVKTS